MIIDHSRPKMFTHTLFVQLSIYLICLFPVTPVHAVEIFVTTNNTELDGDTCDDLDYTGGTGVSVAEAICIANNNGTVSDTIAFPLGNRVITVTQSIPPVTGTITINGNGINNTVIQGGSAPDTANWRIFVVDPGGNLTLNDMTLQNGRCEGSCEFAGTQNGGAIASRGSLTINQCLITGNIVSSSDGGAIANEQGTTTVTNTTFLSNNAGGNGGGGAISNQGTLVLINNTFHSNSTANGDGGAILNSGVANLTNNTLSDNFSSAGNGGGLANSGTLNFTNNIIANTTGGGDCYELGGSNIATNMNNLVEDNSCSPDLSGDPILVPLADNGGPTPTMELFQNTTDSPAINAGDNAACPATDQRGVPRPNGPACDIGAYEAIYIPHVQDFFVTTWKTDNPGASGNTSITIPIVGGPYDLDLDNDGFADEFDLNGATLIDFGAAGTYTIGVHGSIDSIRFANNSDKDKLLSVDQWGTVRWTTMNSSFQGAMNLRVLASDVPDLSLVTDMAWMFDGAILADPDTSNWDMSSVVNMDFMFSGAVSANPDTGNWDTPMVESIRGMFFQATAANPDVSNWNTALVKDMAGMFFGATSARPDVSNWDTGAAEDISLMFYGATSADPDLGDWDVTSVLDANGMFIGVTLSTLNYERLLVKWGAQALQTGVPFHGGDSRYCSSAAAAARDTMKTADSWTITDGGPLCDPGDEFVTSWQTDNPGTSAPDSISVPMVGGPYEVDWGDGAGFSEFGLSDTVTHTYPGAGTYTIRIRGIYDAIFFNGADDKDKILSVDQWGANRWTTMNGAFDGARLLRIRATDAPDLTSVSDASNMFNQAAVINPDLSDWDVTSLTDADGMFAGASLSTGNYERLLISWAAQDLKAGVSFDGGDSNYCSSAAVAAKAKMESTDGWGITDGGPLCSPTDDFVSTWQTDNPGTSGSMSVTFPMSGGPYEVDWGDGAGFSEFGLVGPTTHTYGSDGTYTIRVRGVYDSFRFDPVSDNEKILSVDQWGSNQWKSMREAFYAAHNLEVTATGAPDLSVVADLSYMFYGAGVANPDTSGWDTSRVTDMSHMFALAISADPDVSGWDVTSLTDATDMFQGVSLSSENYDSLLVSWDAQALNPGVVFGGGDSLYCTAQAVAARANMVATDGWLISDGGQCPDTFTVGGTVTGLIGDGLVLQNNGEDDLPISGDGDFTFPTPLGNQSHFNVTVSAQPTNQSCTVENGSGILAGSNAENIIVTCVAALEGVIFGDGFED